MTLFLNLTAHYRICQNKSEENAWDLCSEEKGQDSSKLVSIFSGDWEIYRSGRSLVLIRCSGPIGKPTHWLKYLLIQGLHIRTGHSATWAATVALDCRGQNLRHVKTSWNDSEVTPGEVKLISSTWVHNTSSLVIFIPDKFNLKWETEFLKNRNKGVSESQPLTNTLARFMYNTYRAHTCKRLVNWRNYTKRDLNKKWPNWGSFDIVKSIFLCRQLEKLAVLWLVSWSF